MTDAERIEALLDIVDDSRSVDPERSDRLVVLGLAKRRGRKISPTAAGWFLLGEQGRRFNKD